MGDFSDESNEDENPRYVSMLVVEDSTVIYDSLFAFMSNTEDEEDKKGNSLGH